MSQFPYKCMEIVFPPENNHLNDVSIIYIRPSNRLTISNCSKAFLKS